MQAPAQLLAAAALMGLVVSMLARRRCGTVAERHSDSESISFSYLFTHTFVHYISPQLSKRYVTLLKSTPVAVKISSEFMMRGAHMPRAMLLLYIVATSTAVARATMYRYSCSQL